MQYTYQDRSVIRTLLIILLWLQLALGLAYALAVMGIMATDPTPLINDTAAISDLQLYALFTVFGLAALGFLCYIPSVVFFCMWIHRANRNARALGAHSMTITPGWSAGWFFIPFANWVMPYRAMAEIARASDPDAPGDRWHLGVLPGIVPMWWAAWLISGFMAQISWQIDGTPEALTAAMWLDGLGSLVGVAAAGLAIAVIQRITKDQREKARRTPDAGGGVCLACAYDLRGSGGTHCPECGTPIPGRDDFVVYPADDQPQNPYANY
ncbi:DUF4328 domain-containing protein [Phycisphaeraceae bacterium D3-23]